MKKQLHLVYVPRSDILTLNKKICPLYYSSFIKVKNKNKYSPPTLHFPTDHLKNCCPCYSRSDQQSAALAYLITTWSGCKAANQGRAPALPPKWPVDPSVFAEVGYAPSLG